MAKKFFYNRVYNTKRTITNLIIIGVCIIGVIICFIITSSFEGENHNTPESTLSIKTDVTVEVNDKLEKEIFFSKIENVDLDTIEIKYPDNFDISNTGTYEIGIIVNNKTYNTNLIVVDTTKPELTLKEVSIKESKSYSANDFVESCTDNSNKECNIAFYNGEDEEGNAVDYSKYTSPGTYAIKISATDASGNRTTKETKLTIGTAKTEKPVETTPSTECKYGNNSYDQDNYTLAIDVTTNGCAVNLNLYKSSNLTTEINELMEKETIKIKKDISALNLKGTLALNRKVTAIINKSGDGIVGYELRMTITISTNNSSETIVDYKIDKDGKRVFTTNKYNIS